MRIFLVVLDLKKNDPFIISISHVTLLCSSGPDRRIKTVLQRTNDSFAFIKWMHIYPEYTTGKSNNENTIRNSALHLIVNAYLAYLIHQIIMTCIYFYRFTIWKLVKVNNSIVTTLKILSSFEQFLSFIQKQLQNTSYWLDNFNF